MANLDDLDGIKKIDKKNAQKSINSLANQCQQAWDEVNNLSIPNNYAAAKNIICVGMGGSAYGARIVKSIYQRDKSIRVPLEVVTDYWLPGYVDKNSLVILSSYSGNTEEVLSCAQQALKLKAKIIGVTSGGLLADFLTKNNKPGYIFIDRYNPSKQPRLGSGYLVMALIAILSRLAFVPVNEDEINEIIDFLKQHNQKFKVDSPTEKNLAKKLATKLAESIPVLIVADLLAGAAHAVRNPFHETAKRFALYFVIPELNHHLMEGLKFPEQNRQLLHFLFIDSQLYDKRNRRRLNLTRQVVKRQGIKTDKISLLSKTALGQTMELIQLGSWVTFYSAMLKDVDPSMIPWVDYFKSELKKL